MVKFYFRTIGTSLDQIGTNNQKITKTIGKTMFPICTFQNSLSQNKIS